jgi:hypothetical protein
MVRIIFRFPNFTHSFGSQLKSALLSFPGAVLFREGDPVDCMFLLVEGEAELSCKFQVCLLGRHAHLCLRSIDLLGCPRLLIDTCTFPFVFAETRLDCRV